MLSCYLSQPSITQRQEHGDLNQPTVCQDHTRHLTMDNIALCMLACSSELTQGKCKLSVGKRNVQTCKEQLGPEQIVLVPSFSMKN